MAEFDQAHPLSNKYHILKRTIPSDPDGSNLLALLNANGYPTSFNENQTAKWIAFDGQKETNLESAFDDYLESSPPAFMTKTINMTKDEITVIVRTRGATETDGWLETLS